MTLAVSNANVQAAPNVAVPLVVDVDGTLAVTDLLQESALQFIARHPLEAYRLPAWLFGGKSRLKARLADRVNLRIETVPLRQEVLALIREAQAAGRQVYLSSASDLRYVRALAERIGGIAGVFGSDASINLAGEVKAERLVAAFGAGGYDYVGDAPIDFTVWRSSRKVLAVANRAGFATRVLKTFPNAEIVPGSHPELRNYVKALRVHQWAKNVLLFLPMVAGHRFDIATAAAALLGFFCFCFAASSAYLINDLLDLPNDRDHPRKSRRPLAAGAIPITHGVIMAALLMAAAFALSRFLPLRFSGILLIYVVFTLGYSFFLKRKLLLDVIVLGGLYSLRVFGGVAAISAGTTQWLLMFCLFLFLSLAIVKRCSELVASRAAGRTEAKGRDYQVEDLNVLLALGAAAGYGAVFVVTIYLSSPEVVALYTHPKRLWLVCPLLAYWIGRTLVLANRGDMHDDPVVFALTDRTSWITAAFVAGVIAAST